MVESWVGSMGRLLPRAIREAGHEFTFLTRDLHHYLRSAPEGTAHPLLAARHVLTTNTNDTDALLPFVERTHDVLRFDGVITSCDYYLRTAAQISGRLGLPGPTPEAVENACRKDSTRRVLAETGLPGPRFAVCADWAEAAAAAHDIGYPLVLKPVDLCAGMFVRRADDEAALAHAYRALAAFPVNARGQRRDPVVLLEELLEGPEVSIETVSHGGAVHVIGVTDKSVGGAPAFVETGHMFPAVLDPADTEAAEETARRALKALGLDQVVAHTEIKLTADGPRLVEVNPRPMRQPHHRARTSRDRHRPRRRLRGRRPRPRAGPPPPCHRTDQRRHRLPGTRPGRRTGDRRRRRHRPRGRRPAGTPARRPRQGRQSRRSNNEYLGHVMAGDAQGPAARTRVETLLAQLRPRVVTR